MVKKMYCKKCKNVIADNEYYCPYCGFNNKKDEYVEKTERVTIKTCFKNFIVKSFFADGIATRMEYWVIIVIYLCISISLGIFGLNYINTIINIITFIPIMTLTIRRYHDTNKSGFFAILGGYFRIGYLFSFFFSDKTVRLSLLITSIIALLIELFLLSMPSNKNSKWNPINGYLE